MSAVNKTEKLARSNLPIGKLYVNKDNPNEMTDEEFNLLFDNIERVGMTDPILVRSADSDGRHRIIGGAHRYEVAKVLAFEEVPCTIVEDPDFSDDDEKFQLVRHNIIHGEMNPKKFVKLYQSLTDDYSEEIASEMFGFAAQEDFNKLIRTTRAGLPKEHQKEFDKASKDIKTIEQLADVLNGLFAKHGDTLPYGYMIVDFGGKDSVWLRMTQRDRRAFDKVADLCKLEDKQVSGLVMSLLQLIARGDTLSLSAALDMTKNVDLGD